MHFILTLRQNMENMITEVIAVAVLNHIYDWPWLHVY
jgi:hypothetical protein